ncbi:Ribosome biogenesis protein BMS1-like protein [Trichoplax sp. H2]|nr:Ribosome biogenesis protein BMS1-like protein [Trichoplax sp. H2]|eukprot:RDD40843.1 Ribosome biogenesis protein BMS1-like protein [Trichoplax sp. H2]
MAAQSELNRKEFEGLDDESRIQYEGYRPGSYVRIELHGMPCEFIDYFDPKYPIIIGALNSGEENTGCVQVRIRKHRWYKRILKTRDPVIMSLGWRRFQTVPLFCMEDHNGRQRLLKYTPEHVHCTATFFGPITAPGTGFLVIQTTNDKVSHFRVMATGTVRELDKSVAIVKKLKLIGTPLKIFKNTAFIKGMFSSTSEVAAAEGATIRTVSGIRGQIKRPVKSPEGVFRATFEDKILLSDIVFLRAWYPVDIPQFYNPVTSLLMPRGEKTEWQGMKTVGQLRALHNIKPPQKSNSLYHPIEREPKQFNPLLIPPSLQKALPYKNKPKYTPKTAKKSSILSRPVSTMSSKEKKLTTLMQQLRTIEKDRLYKKKVKKEAERKVYMKKKEAEENKRHKKMQERRQEYYRKIARAGKGK